MAISVVMPALEMAQETGKLLAWRKKEGEQVTKGEPLLEIETDKAVVEVEAPGDGLLASVTARVGDEIPVGQTIAWLVKPGEEPPAGHGTKAQSGRASSVSGSSVAATASAVSVSQSSNVIPQISPKARRLAKELGVDFTAIHGTGPDGVITAEDVQAFAEGQRSTAVQPGAPAEESLSVVARLMAERTTQSWTQVPHFFVSRDVDCAELLKAKKSLSPGIEQKHGAKLSITDLLVALAARVLAKHPSVNAAWKNGAIHLNKDVNISVAIAVKDGVVNAVIHNTQTTQLADICVQRHKLTELARSNHLRPVDISGGTFTISNLGMYKVDAFTAIIPPGQAAILAVAGISDRVVARDGKPDVRPLMTLTLSSDHRVIDGARAALFFGELAEAILAPTKWLD
jgi:pyruvate dehydrogenase E2 component (dihydrolipoyllysine-residue acetyltransferase)